MNDLERILLKPPMMAECSRCHEKYKRIDTDEPVWVITKKLPSIRHGRYYDIYNLCPKCMNRFVKFMRMEEETNGTEQE